MRYFAWMVIVFILLLTWKFGSPCKNKQGEPMLQGNVMRGICKVTTFRPRIFLRTVCIGYKLFSRCKWKWGPCSVTCGVGNKQAHLTHKAGHVPRLRGVCNMPTKPEPCDTEICCPEDGEWYTPQQSWSPCSYTCGKVGVQTKNKVCREPQCGGRPCGVSSRKERQRCYSGPCPINCSWDTWGSWTVCSRSCGGGLRARERTYAVVAKHGGKSCQGHSHEITACMTECCPENCAWSEWKSWGSCSASCDWGVQHRRRGEKLVISCGGQHCTGSPTENRVCYLGCCSVDCKWAQWGTWSECTRSCGTGSQRRHRLKSVLSYCGGNQCPGEAYENQSCNENCCPSDCEWDEWSELSECSKSCDLGVVSKTRNVSKEASCGGEQCQGSNFETEYCNAFCCPGLCLWDDWSEWSECSETCGMGQQTRKRSVEIDPNCGVKRCQEPHHEERNCTTGCCPVDCEVSAWTQWSECSASCGPGGVKSRFRNITREPQCDGRECEPPEQTALCNRFCVNGGILDVDGCRCMNGWQGECCEKEITEESGEAST